MMAAFYDEKLKPLNLHDLGSESAIDPINPLVYIQARNFQFFKSLKIEDNLNISPSAEASNFV